MTDPATLPTAVVSSSAAGDLAVMSSTAAGDLAAVLPAGTVGLLAEDGTFTPDAEWPVDLDGTAIRRLHVQMAVTRAVDDEAIALQRQGQLGTYSPCRGQEAAQVGSAAVLAPEDWIFPSYRETGAAIARGMDPARLLHRSRGTWLSGHDPYAERFALVAVPIATQTLHAVGFAMGARRDTASLVVLTYLGDGATSEGDAHEALNFAAVYQAPCVFFVQNNGWAISVPTARQLRAPSLAHRGIGYGMPGVRCDGNDLLAVYAVTSQAVARARAGDGPTLIEAVTYRMGAHTTSDDPTRYQPAAERAAWEARDPLRRTEAYLRREGLWDAAFEEEVGRACQEAAASVRAQLWDAPAPDPEELFEHVYADPPEAFAHQREQLRRELEARRGARDGS